MTGVWLYGFLALWAVVLVEGIMLILLYRQIGFFYLGTASGVSRDGLPAGTAAPTFTGTDLDGTRRTVGGISDGWTLVVFGSANCPACRALAPDLNMVLNHFARRIAVVFLSFSPEDATVAFTEETGMHMPVIPMPTMDLLHQYDVRVTPFSFLIDPAGVIRSKGLTNNIGHIQWIVREADEALVDKLNLSVSM